MLKLVVIGCGICGVILVGRFGIWKLKEHTTKAASGSDTSPMSIISRGLLCLQDQIGPWSLPEVLLGLAAMAKITEKDPLNMPGHPVDLANDSEFLMKAQHWRAMAEAIYVSDPASFSLFSHLPESSIVAANWNSDQESLRPAYALAVDPAFGSLVLSIRGTSHVIDLLVSAGASPVEFEGGHAHSGFARATDSLLKEVLPHIQRVFEQNSYKLVIVGHSMGAAIGCMCGLKLKNKYEDLECWGYSVPASVSIDLARACASFVTCFVCLHDVVPRFSITSIEDLRKRICNFDWERVIEIAKDDEEWQNISKAVEAMQKFQQTQSAVASNVESFQKKVCSLVSKDEHGDDHGCSDNDDSELPCLHPPGRLLVLSSDPPACGKVPAQRSGVSEQRNYGAFPSYEEAKNVKWEMHEASQEDFSQIILSPWSVSDHVLGNLCEGIHFFQARSSPVRLG